MKEKTQKKRKPKKSAKKSNRRAATGSRGGAPRQPRGRQFKVGDRVVFVQGDDARLNSVLRRYQGKAGEILQVVGRERTIQALVRFDDRDTLDKSVVPQWWILTSRLRHE